MHRTYRRYRDEAPRADWTTVGLLALLVVAVFLALTFGEAEGLAQLAI